MPIVNPPAVIVPEGESVLKGTVALPDGRVVRLVSMRSSDGPRLLRFHRTLSPRTTYLRFFGLHPELSATEVQHFVEVDHHDREAIIATVDEELVAVARFDREPGTDSGEVAFLVADGFQGQGIGRALFAALRERAGQEGIGRFVADVLPHNSRMLRLFADTGLPERRRFEDGVVRVELDLDGGEAQ